MSFVWRALLAVESVQYHQLVPMLLNELQRQQRELGELRAQTERLQAALLGATGAAELGRRTTTCKSPAIANDRCHMHGGASTGAPKGNKNALKHGLYTAESIAFRREMAQLAREETAESIF
jgi:hypothetical protein